MAIERNAPCPCGSGKKYKKCCLAKDEAAPQEKRSHAHAALLEATLPPSPARAPEAPGLPSREPKAPKPPDPLMDAWNARWEEFDQADYETRVALFEQTLAEGELMDAEMVSETTGQLFEQAIEHNERDRFDALMEQLRERLPNVYDEQAHWLIGYQIKNALATGRLEKVASLTQQMAALIAKQIDNWNALEEELAYHGQLEPVLTAMRAAWAAVKRSADILPWGIDEFATRAAQYEMLWHIEQTFGSEANDLALLERLRFFAGDELDPERTAETLRWLRGQTTPAWTLQDFAFIPPHSDKVKQAEREEANRLPSQNLFHLTLQFMRYLNDDCGVPLSKAEIASQKLHEYLIDRREGKLEAQPGLFETARQTKSFPPVAHPLCPDRERLDRFLVKDFGFLSLSRHAAFALVELTPLWVRFLVAQALLTAEAGEQAFHQLKPLTRDLHPFIGTRVDETQWLQYWGAKL
jgi:hypothetical protein